MEKLNERNAEKKLRRKLNAGCVPGDYHITLTYLGTRRRKKMPGRIWRITSSGWRGLYKSMGLNWDGWRWRSTGTRGSTTIWFWTKGPTCWQSWINGTTGARRWHCFDETICSTGPLFGQGNKEDIPGAGSEYKRNDGAAARIGRSRRSRRRWSSVNDGRRNQDRRKAMSWKRTRRSKGLPMMDTLINFTAW